jgi:phosphoethanolamine N-methyltransferase
MTTGNPVQTKKETTRDEFRSYWVEEHGAPTLENMMLDSNAAIMDVLERPEILAELPSLNDKAVLELGSGIGRFSSSLAANASSVIAVDFVEASCKINMESNSHYENLEVICEDALKLTFPANSFDIVFSNWLLMYLTDAEVQALASRCLNWLKPGGRIFFRESCFHRSGNAARSWNPTVYRDPRSYFKFFNSARGEDGSRFQLCKTSCVHAYVRIKNNPNQVWWIWEKCTTGHLVRYLDTQQYDYNSVFRYEKLYGPGFISTGGEKLISSIGSDHLNIKPGTRVLDVGCGLGGNMLFFANKGCFVHGIDISGVMVSIASERYLKYPAEIQQRISVQVGDVFDSNFIPNSFDVICCRDFLMHFSDSDKEILLSKFHRWLAPGGSVLITDYVKGPAAVDASSDFNKYVEERQYQLLSDTEYLKLFENLNFKARSVDTLNLTDSPTGSGLSRKQEFKKYLEEQVAGYRERVEDRIQSISQLKNSIKFEDLFKTVFNAVSEARSDPEDELALRVAQAGTDAARDYVESKESLLKEEHENLEWVQKYWGIKAQAVDKDELVFSVFIAQTPKA